MAKMRLRLAVSLNQSQAFDLKRFLVGKSIHPANLSGVTRSAVKAISVGPMKEVVREDALDALRGSAP
jgi:hypothetical protein